MRDGWTREKDDMGYTVYRWAGWEVYRHEPDRLGDQWTLYRPGTAYVPVKARTLREAKDHAELSEGLRD